MVLLFYELLELLVTLGISQVGREIAQVGEEFLFDLCIDGVGVVAVFGAEGFANISLEPGFVILCASDTNNGEMIADFFTCHEVIKSGDELDLGQIACDAKDDEGKVFHTLEFSI